MEKSHNWKWVTQNVPQNVFEIIMRILAYRLCALFNKHYVYHLFLLNNFFLKFFNLERIICTPKLCNKKYRSLCSFKRKHAFILLLSSPWGKCILLCMCVPHSHADLPSFVRVINDTKSYTVKDVRYSAEESP